MEPFIQMVQLSYMCADVIRPFRTYPRDVSPRTYLEQQNQWKATDNGVAAMAVPYNYTITRERIIQR